MPRTGRAPNTQFHVQLVQRSKDMVSYKVTVLTELLEVNSCPTSECAESLKHKNLEGTECTVGFKTANMWVA